MVISKPAVKPCNTHEKSFMKKTYLVAIGMVALAIQSGSAASLYSENFQSYTPSSTGPVAFGGFGQMNNVGTTPWQIQGGGGGGGINVATVEAWIIMVLAAARDFLPILTTRRRRHSLLIRRRLTV